MIVPLSFCCVGRDFSLPVGPAMSDCSSSPSTPPVAEDAEDACCCFYGTLLRDPSRPFWAAVVIERHQAPRGLRSTCALRRYAAHRGSVPGTGAARWSVAMGVFVGVRCLQWPGLVASNMGGLVI